MRNPVLFTAPLLAVIAFAFLLSSVFQSGGWKLGGSWVVAGWKLGEAGWELGTFSVKLCTLGFGMYLNTVTASTSHYVFPTKFAAEPLVLWPRREDCGGGGLPLCVRYRPHWQPAADHGAFRGALRAIFLWVKTVLEVASVRAERGV